MLGEANVNESGERFERSGSSERERTGTAAMQAVVEDWLLRVFCDDVLQSTKLLDGWDRCAGSFGSFDSRQRAFKRIAPGNSCFWYSQAVFDS